MMKVLDLKGVIPPMITPLTSEGAIDTAAIGRLVEHMLAGGCAGIFALGSSGEGPWLTTEQRKQVIVSTVRAVSGRVPVLVGALEPSAGRVLEALPMLEDLGANAVVVAAPYYFGADTATQCRYFGQIATASRLPVVLYNIPQMTHNLVTADTVRETLRFENVIGIKDSAGDMVAFARFVALKQIRPDFRIFQGAEKLSVQGLLAGADGLVPGLGNLVPQWFAPLYNAIRNERESEAHDLQAQVNRLWALHEYDYWLICLKYAASVLGFGSGDTCGHVANLDESERAAIRALVAEVKPA